MGDLQWWIAALGAAALGWWLWRRGRAREPFRSLIALLREPRLIQGAHLERAAAQAGLHGVRVEAGPPLRILHETGEYEVISGPAPYVPGSSTKEAIAGRIREVRLRDAFLEHNAWFSIVIDRLPEGGTPGAAYAFAGRLIAELVDDTALALWSSEDDRAQVLTPKLVKACRRGEVLQGLAELFDDPITRVDSRDRRMKAAIEEARRRWPELVDSFSRHHGSDDYIVKFPFQEGEEVEHMWVQIREIEGDLVRGTLMNRPRFCRGLKEGQMVERRAEELSDWAYIEGGEARGAFAEQIVRGG